MSSSLQAERHVQDPVPATMCVKGGQLRRFLIKMDAPEAILSIELAACGTIELMTNLLKGGGFVVLSNNGLV